MRLVVISMLFLVAAPAAARPLPLATVQAEAERLAPSVVVAQRQLAVARAEIAVAGTLQNPNLSLLTSRLTARLSAGLSVPLPIFGQRATAMAAATADAAAVELGIEQAQLFARYAATTAWVDLWAAQQRSLLLGRAVAAATRFHDLASERFAAGSAPRLDVIRAAAELARVTAESAAAQATIAAAAARLLPWVAAVDDADDPLVAQGQPNPVAVPGLFGLRQLALGHPLLRRARAQLAAALAHVRDEKRQRLPVVSGLLTVNVADQTLPGLDVLGGASFELPILSQRGGAIARAQAQVAVAAATLELDQRQTQADVGDVYHSLQAAAGRALALRSEVRPATEEAAKMTEDSYRDGRSDLVRLLEAQRAVIEAQQAELEAVATWSKSVAELERAVGRRLDGE